MAPAPALKAPLVIVWWGGVPGKRRCYTLGKQNLGWGWGTKGRRDTSGRERVSQGWSEERGDRNFLTETGTVQRDNVTLCLVESRNKYGEAPLLKQVPLTQIPTSFDSLNETKHSMLSIWERVQNLLRFLDAYIMSYHCHVPVDDWKHLTVST